MLTPFLILTLLSTLSQCLHLDNPYPYLSLYSNNSGLHSKARFLTRQYPSLAETVPHPLYSEPAPKTKQ